MTKVQIPELMRKYAEKEKGLHDLMEIMYLCHKLDRAAQPRLPARYKGEAIPNEESVLTLMGSVAMEHKTFDRFLPNITWDKSMILDRKYRFS